MDLSQISQKLEALSSKDMLAPLEPVPDTDIDNFLMNETQNVLLGILEETQNFVRTFQKIFVILNHCLSELWKAKRKSQT